MIYLIGKIATYIFLPPGIFMLLLILLFFMSYRTHRRTTRTILLLLVLLLYASSIEPVSRLLMTPLERVHPFRTPESFISDTSAADPAEVIIVLGGGITAGPATTENSLRPAEGKPSDNASAEAAPAVRLPSPETLSRLIHGYRIHLSTGLPLLVSGGSPHAESPGTEGPSEASVMRDYLLSLGVMDKQVRTEETSRNTAENAGNIASLETYEKIILVTSAYHMPRSLWLFEQAGFSVSPAPSNFTNSGENLTIWSFLPSMQGFSTTYRALHEYGGILLNLFQFRINEKKG